MTDIRSLFSIQGKTPVYQLVVSVFLIVFLGLFLFSGSLLVLSLFTNSDFTKIPNMLSSDLNEKDIGLLRYVLVSQELSFFLLPGILILKIIKTDNQNSTIYFSLPEAKDILLVVVLGFCLFPITSYTGVLNSEMHFPHWLSGVEKWMTEKESDTDQIMNVIMSPCTFLDMSFNLFMIAVLPAIGEELIFRGIFQKVFTNLFRSGHVAIWFTAFLFSALHFQFFGFLPRFILGLVFGYLFFWSGTLWLPIISHFLNNAVSVVVIYLQGGENSIVTPELSSTKQLLTLPLPLIVGILILIYFYYKMKRGSVKQLDFTD